MLKGYREFFKFLMLYWVYYDFKVMNYWVYLRYNIYFLYLDDDFFFYQMLNQLFFDISQYVFVRNVEMVISGFVCKLFLIQSVLEI